MSSDITPTRPPQEAITADNYTTATNDTNLSITNMKELPNKSRKQLRFEAKLLRRKSKQYVDTSVYYWARRLMNEMKDNKSVQEKVLSGALDRFLPQVSSDATEE